MALKIRLSRGGSKSRPYYHVVIAENRARRDGRFIERVGHYNPLLASNHPERITLNAERIAYWYGVGARPTDKVARFMSKMNITDIKYVIPKQNKKNQPKEKAMQRMKSNN